MTICSTKITLSHKTKKCWPVQKKISWENFIKILQTTKLPLTTFKTIKTETKKRTVLKTAQTLSKKMIQSTINWIKNLNQNSILKVNNNSILRENRLELITKYANQEVLRKAVSIPKQVTTNHPIFPRIHKNPSYPSKRHQARAKGPRRWRKVAIWEEFSEDSESSRGNPSSLTRFSYLRRRLDPRWLETWQSPILMPLNQDQWIPK